MVMNLIDFGMDIDEAINAPRISFVEPDSIAVERTIPVEILEGLRSRGHNVREVRALGNAHGLTILYDREGRPAAFKGTADRRGGGLAAGYSPDS